MAVRTVGGAMALQMDAAPRSLHAWSVPVDPRTLERVRELFSGRSDVEEKRMVGGRSFVVRGHLCCGVTAQGLVVRLGPEGAARARDETHVRPLVMGGREVTAFVVVDPEGYADDDELARWVSRAVASVEDKS